MATPAHPRRLYQFGPFRLDPINRVLHREGDIVPLSPAVVETLRVLVEKRGNAVAKEELLSAVWPDTYVEESSLAHNISVLRKALGEGPGEQRFIQTIPKRGYRFVAAVADVEEMPSTEPSAAGEAPGARLSVLPQPRPRRAWVRRSVWAISLAALAAAIAVSYLGTRPPGNPAARNTTFIFPSGSSARSAWPRLPGSHPPVTADRSQCS